jgi:hypothetical protein
VNLHLSGFIGCSVTFAIHLIASQISKRPIVSLLLTTALGAALVVQSLATPLPPAPPTPSVPAMAYVKGIK